MSDNALDMLYDYLPEQPRAWALCETYMEQATWAFRPILRDELIDDTLAPIYKHWKERRTPGFSGPHTISSHRLALLFIVFAHGSLVDLTLESCKCISFSRVQA